MSTKTLSIPQGSLVTPREPIAIGRMKASPGQTFWVTDSKVTRESRGNIQLARSGLNAGNAKAFSFADFERFFAVVSDFSPDEARSHHGNAVAEHMAETYPNLF